MRNSVKGLGEIQEDYTHHLPLIHTLSQKEVKLLQQDFPLMKLYGWCLTLTLLLSDFQ